MLDKLIFLGLRDVYWPEVTVQQIEKWYGYFMPVVQKYDDIVNNHIKHVSKELYLIVGMLTRKKLWAQTVCQVHLNPFVTSK